MSSIIILYASTTGNTQYVAELLAAGFGPSAHLLPLEALSQDVLAEADLVIGCVSTWGRGEMQDDWDLAHERLRALDLGGKLAAVCGLGDQRNYPERFADGARVLADIFRDCGASLVGQTPTGGYTFEQSRAVEGRQFVGLLIDEENQHAQTEDRVRAWVKKLKTALPRGAK